MKEEFQHGVEAHEQLEGQQESWAGGETGSAVFRATFVHPLPHPCQALKKECTLM